MLRFRSYAENLRNAAKGADNAQGRPVRMREISAGTGISYERIRSLWQSNKRRADGSRVPFSVSEECNEVLCNFLGLPIEEMWQLAQMEKVERKLGYRPQLPSTREGEALMDLWEKLDPIDHKTLVGLAKTLVEARTGTTVSY